MHRLSRYWHTIRHLRPAQLAHRIRLRVKGRIQALSPRLTTRWYLRQVPHVGLAPTTWRTQTPLAIADHAAWTATAAALETGTFEYLNERRALGRPVPWHAPGASRLWRFHLHYFDELPGLALLGPSGRAVIESLVDEWRIANPVGLRTTDAWQPYVVSVRIVNWVLALSLAPDAAPMPDAVRASLATHLRYLEHALEDDVGGNHLLKNLKALVFGGCCFAGPRAERWRARGIARLDTELRRQVLADGGHYERAPSYHSQVLEDLLETMAVLNRYGHAIPATFSNAAHAMRSFLTRICHPDGDIPLFNDSALGMTVSPAALIAFADRVLDGAATGPLAARHRLAIGPDVGTGVAAGPWPPAAAADSGYHVLATPDRRQVLIADAGAVCPDDLPAHAHADLLSYELSLDGRRVVVDGGVADYAAGPWRDYWRSTRAHNTVSVDDAEQSDCWGAFRVARRARPRDVRLVHGDHVRGLEAAHTGFQHLPSPVIARRLFALIDERFWIIWDRLEGQQAHRWISRVHLHPAVQLEGAGVLRMTRDGADAILVTFGDVRLQTTAGGTEPLEGWYAERLSQRVPCPTLLMSGQGTLPVDFGYLIVPQPPSRVTVDRGADHELVVRLGSDRYDVRLPPAAPWTATRRPGAA